MGLKAAIVAGRPEVASAFTAMGFEGNVVKDALEAKQRIESLIATKRYGLILVASEVAEAWSDSATARRLVVPVVVVIQTTAAGTVIASDHMRRLIENAVGMDIVGKMAEEKNHDTR